MTAQAPAMQWNAGAWFGSLIGCTTWLALLGLGIARYDVMSASVLLVCVGLVWWDSVRVWKQHATRDLWRSLQRLCVVALVASAAGLTFAFWRDAVPQYSPLTFGLCLLIYPAMIGLFEFRHRAAQQGSSSRP